MEEIGVSDQTDLVTALFKKMPSVSDVQNWGIKHAFFKQEPLKTANGKIPQVNIALGSSSNGIEGNALKLFNDNIITIEEIMTITKPKKK
ncbi:hypothetical protein [Flammeovirga aprica]|uniref:Uncharacterized protein n=1 Tax=Flammeovirga aprica JL-4 TaxID=694437 RepID=A0A7X9XDP6_9BACT|nr:hypothetical protein [Flammeovirga aprica]NME73015.1 hypothetical protein [Flammeovirga aprica JL-4]